MWLAGKWRKRHDGDLEVMDCPDLLDERVVTADDSRSAYVSARPNFYEVNLLYRRQIAHLRRRPPRRPAALRARNDGSFTPLD
jgi:hypothetical protein